MRNELTTATCSFSKVSLVLRRTDDDGNPLVQLGCAVVGVQLKDLAQHLEKLMARARVGKLRYDHFFTGSG
jgi:hypothetical protein